MPQDEVRTNKIIVFSTEWLVSKVNEACGIDARQAISNSKHIPKFIMAVIRA